MSGEINVNDINNIKNLVIENKHVISDAFDKIELLCNKLIEKINSSTDNKDLTKLVKEIKIEVVNSDLKQKESQLVKNSPSTDIETNEDNLSTLKKEDKDENQSTNNKGAENTESKIRHGEHKETINLKKKSQKKNRTDNGKTHPWREHIRKVKMENPEINSFGKIIQIAKETYKANNAT